MIIVLEKSYTVENICRVQNCHKMSEESESIVLTSMVQGSKPLLRVKTLEIEELLVQTLRQTRRSYCSLKAIVLIRIWSYCVDSVSVLPAPGSVRTSYFNRLGYFGHSQTFVLCPMLYVTTVL